MFAAKGHLVASIFPASTARRCYSRTSRVSQATVRPTADQATAIGPDAGTFCTTTTESCFWRRALHGMVRAPAHHERFQVVNGGRPFDPVEAHAAAQLKQDDEVPLRVITTAHDKDFAQRHGKPQQPESVSNRVSYGQTICRWSSSSALASRGWYLERRESEIRTLTVHDRTTLEARFGAPLEDKDHRLRREYKRMWRPTWASGTSERYTKQIFVAKLMVVPSRKSFRRI